MKHLISFALCFLLTGCVSSDPAQNLINQQQLIGVWNLHSVIINGKVMDLSDTEDDEYIHIDFCKNNDLIFSTDDPETQAAINEIDFKYIVDGGRIRILSFVEKKNNGEFSFDFKVRHNILILKKLKMKDSYFGRINLKALFPDVRNVSVVLRRV